jgi:hypothetical protein
VPCRVFIFNKKNFLYCVVEGVMAKVFGIEKALVYEK